MESSSLPPSAPKEVIRKLVTVRRIASVTPIKTPQSGRKGRGGRNGPQLSVVSVDGWDVVVDTSDAPLFNVGQLVVFFQIDSFIPASDGNFWQEMAACATEFDGKTGFRVKTERVRGADDVVSQGRVFPIDAYPAVKRIGDQLVKEHGKNEGVRRLMEMKLDKVVGVVKWDVPDDMRGASYGPPPNFFRQPGATRIQDTPYLFELHGHKTVEVTEKLDGVAISIYYVRDDSPANKFLPRAEGHGVGVVAGGRIGVCTRYDDLVPGGAGALAWDVVARRLDIPAKLARTGRSLVVQGELVGPTILGNSMGYRDGDEHEFYAFSVWEVDGPGKGFLGEREARATLERMDIPQVPLMGYFKLRDLGRTNAELLAWADGVGMRGEGHLREGWVLRNMKEDVGFKVISNEWLVNYGR